MRVLVVAPDVIQTLDTKDQSNVSTFASAGRLKTVQLMLDAGFNIEARADDLDATPVLYAASNGDVAMLDLLIARGARLDVKHKYDGSPIDTAIYCAAHFPNPHGDYVTTVHHLIEAGEKVREEFLELAFANDLEEIAVVLKAHGAAL